MEARYGIYIIITLFVLLISNLARRYLIRLLFYSGSDVVIVKSGRRICGTGGALGNAPLVQDKAYFEMKLQSTGIWGFGVATRKCNLNTLPLGSKTESWVLRSDGTICHNGEVTHKIEGEIAEGDIIVSWFLYSLQKCVEVFDQSSLYGKKASSPYKLYVFCFVYVYRVLHMIILRWTFIRMVHRSIFLCQGSVAQSTPWHTLMRVQSLMSNSASSTTLRPQDSTKSCLSSRYYDRVHSELNGADDKIEIPVTISLWLTLSSGPCDFCQALELPTMKLVEMFERRDQGFVLVPLRWLDIRSLLRALTYSTKYYRERYLEIVEGRIHHPQKQDAGGSGWRRGLFPQLSTLGPQFESPFSENPLLHNQNN